MNVFSRLWSRWQNRRRVDDSPWEGDTPAWLASLLVHLGILAGLTLLGTVMPRQGESVTLFTMPAAEEPLAVSQEFSYSSTPQETIGSSSSSADGKADAMLAVAPTLAMTAVSSGQLEVADQSPHVSERIRIQEEIRVATGPRFAENLSIKGAAGVGATGAVGAIDRITQEILLSLEERKTLVVWLFDQSGSLERQRAEIIKRFDRIYEELGVIEASGNPAFKRHDSKPLLSAVVAFGQSISFLSARPTDNVGEIKSSVAGMKTDASGIERTFQAVYEATGRYRQFRTQEPRRNVMFVIFTDEVGDDEADLDRTVAICRRLEIPVFCIGVPAPFGRREASIKYVDPDPKYDQTPQWVPVRQGPESFMPELVKIGSEEADEPMDSGFGPYSLTRLCVETGGIFFAVHPNRDERRVVTRNDTAILSAQLSHFFDPQIMRNYKPDYVSIKEYQKLLAENKARAKLVEASQMSWITPMERPVLNFPKINDADLANRLTTAQHAAAALEPKINQLYEILKQGEKDRPRLTKPRWQASYDLSMGRVLALKVRTESYNAMLAKAKQGMRFQDRKDDTWRLLPADEITVGSTLEKLAEQARVYLERVVREHPKTPWALLAENELKQPLGWQWKELYAGVNVPRQVAGGGGNAGRPQNDKARSIPRPQKRPTPKL
ncbi:MAG: VWA domain-containing protein [Planctomycetia bacterium]|nr:VWA domain-containing protein [Planctomycetia bacterium]